MSSAGDQQGVRTVASIKLDAAIGTWIAAPEVQRECIVGFIADDVEPINLADEDIQENRRRVADDKVVIVAAQRRVGIDLDKTIARARSRARRLSRRR